VKRRIPCAYEVRRCSYGTIDAVSETISSRWQQLRDADRRKFANATRDFCCIARRAANRDLGRP